MLQPQPASSLKIPFFLLVGGLVLAALLITTIFFKYAGPNKKKPSSKITLDIIVFSQPRSIEPFQLRRTTEKSSKPIFSQQDFLRHWTFLFFGFTHCSAICPATLAELNEVYQKQHAHHPELQIVFVSIDPEQDKVADIQHYLASFNKQFIGLSGTAKQLSAVQRQFGVIAERDKTLGLSGLNHTSSVFLINPQGQWLALFPYGMRSKQIQTHLKTIIETTTHV